MGTWSILYLNGRKQCFRPKKIHRSLVTTDLRALNNSTTMDSYPMKDVQDTPDWIEGKKIYSSFSIKDGFEDESKPLTAVSTFLGMLQYTSFPQGLKISLVTFQRILNIFLGDYKVIDVLKYVYDTCVGSNKKKSPLAHYMML